MQVHDIIGQVFHRFTANILGIKIDNSACYTINGFSYLHDLQESLLWRGVCGLEDPPDVLGFI